MVHERNVLDEEERRAAERREELERRVAQIDADLVREQDLLGDTSRVLEELGAEEVALRTQQDLGAEVRASAAVSLQEAAEALSRAQEAADEAGALLSELTARRNTILRSIDEHAARVGKLENELSETQGKREALLARFSVDGDAQNLASAVDHAIAEAADFEQAAGSAEATVRLARAPRPKAGRLMTTQGERLTGFRRKYAR